MRSGGEIVVNEFSKIAENYYKKGMFLDLIPLIPFELFASADWEYNLILVIKVIRFRRFVESFNIAAIMRIVKKHRIEHLKGLIYHGSDS